MKRFVIGDIHGNIKALKQCLSKSNFDYNQDKLIVLGDTCDGIPFVKDCFDELLKIKNLIHILGNHGDWTMEWYTNKSPVKCPEDIWYNQGGKQTIKSYGGILGEMPTEHLNILKNSPLYYIEDEKYLFVHGGIDPNQKNINIQTRDTLLWDRDLIEFAKGKHYQKPNYKYGGWERIYVGHTTTEYYKSIEPLKFCNVQMLDTGAGWSGKLTIMDIDTNEFWQSDLVKDLYPNIKDLRK